MSDSPAEKRKWSLKRKLLVFAGLPLLLLIGGLLILDAMAGGRLNTAMHEAREDGGPVTYKELEGARKVWPDAQNGAKIILALTPRLDQLSKDSGLKVLPPFSDQPDSSLGTRLSPEALTAAEAELKRLEADLAAIDQLRQYQGGQFPITIAANPVMTLLPNMSTLRTSAKLKAAQAQCRAMRGDTSNLVDDVTIIRRHAQLVDEDPFLISSLVGISLDNLAIDTIERSLALTSAPPEQLKRLDELLATMEGPNRIAWGMRGERACFIGASEYVRANGASALLSSVSAGGGQNGGVSPVFSSRVTSYIPGVRGLLLHDQTTGMHLLNRMVAATKDRRNAKTILRKVETELDSLPPYYVLTRSFIPALSRAFELEQKGEAVVRASRVGLAVERYRLDTGHFPASLDELVPKYLPAIPTDPFDGRPLRYLNDQYGIVIYSVGEDEKDDGGQVTSRRPGGRNPTDWGFALLPPELRGRLTTQPATEPSSETPEEKAERLRRFREGAPRTTPPTTQ